MVVFTGCSPDVLFFSDDKPWKMTKSGNGCLDWLLFKCIVLFRWQAMEND